MKDYIDITIGLIAIIGVVWRLAQVKSEIDKDNERLKDYLESKLSKLEQDLKVHLTEYAGKKELLEYQLHGMDEKLNHKFSRCWAEIKQQQSFLVKQGFIPREDNTL